VAVPYDRLKCLDIGTIDTKNDTGSKTEYHSSNYFAPAKEIVADQIPQTDQSVHRTSAQHSTAFPARTKAQEGRK